MDSALLIIVCGLAAVFLLSGMTQLICSREQLISRGLTAAEAFSTSTLKSVGALQVLAAIGLVAPVAVDMAPSIAAAAAAGLALLMIGATVVHARRKELHLLIVNVVLLALATVVIFGAAGRHELGV